MSESLGGKCVGAVFVLMEGGRAGSAMVEEVWPDTTILLTI